MDKLEWGVYGVDLFFAISGLLICGRLLREQREQGSFSLRDFYVRRVFRIIPLVAVYILVVWLLVVSHRLRVRPIELLSCIFFFRNYITQDPWSFVTAHFWTLAVEEHFYLIWPGLLALLGSRRARMWVVPIALGIAVWRLGAAHYYYSYHTPRNFYIRSDIRLDAPLWGCWAALLIDGGWTKTLTNFLIAPVAIILGLACLFCFAFHPPFERVLVAASIPLILLSTVLHPEGLAAKVLELPSIRWIGRLSYSLYIWQQIFLLWPTYPRPLPLGWLQRWPINFVAMMVFAVISYYLVEKPSIALGRSIVQRFQRPRFAASTAIASS
jgi:peptidoglycan/LPS O-acetylase OafA/YrhL